MNSANASDLVQEIALRLWRWTTNHHEKSESMSDDEWRAFAARTAYNELSRSLSRERTPIANIDPDDVAVIEASLIEGQTEIEVVSLIRLVWQGICGLSLRQRRALLLHSQELIIYFLQTGITEKQLTETLDLSEKDWIDICDRLPMTDAEIAERTEGTAGSIKKARYEARVKLEGSIRK
ncbi:MAG: sigma-70 family RNA polymerase sigma factor [Acidobacteriota bacterium]|nr:MAG: sigma-70 family RNA polymerase sigma factor [Acidobacteriota bacterium]